MFEIPSARAAVKQRERDFGPVGQVDRAFSRFNDVPARFDDENVRRGPGSSHRDRVTADAEARRKSTSRPIGGHGSYDVNQTIKSALTAASEAGLTGDAAVRFVAHYIATDETHARHEGASLADAAQRRGAQEIHEVRYRKTDQGWQFVDPATGKLGPTLEKLWNGSPDVLSAQQRDLVRMLDVAPRGAQGLVISPADKAEGSYQSHFGTFQIDGKGDLVFRDLFKQEAPEHASEQTKAAARKAFDELIDRLAPDARDGNSPTGFKPVLLSSDRTIDAARFHSVLMNAIDHHHTPDDRKFFERCAAGLLEDPVARELQKAAEILERAKQYEQILRAADGGALTGTGLEKVATELHSSMKRDGFKAVSAESAPRQLLAQLDASPNARAFAALEFKRPTPFDPNTPPSLTSIQRAQTFNPNSRELPSERPPTQTARAPLEFQPSAHAALNSLLPLPPANARYFEPPLREPRVLANPPPQPVALDTINQPRRDQFYIQVSSNPTRNSEPARFDSPESRTSSADALRRESISAHLGAREKSCEIERAASVHRESSRIVEQTAAEISRRRMREYPTNSPNGTAGDRSHLRQAEGARARQHTAYRDTAQRIFLEQSRLTHSRSSSHSNARQLRDTVRATRQHAADERTQRDLTSATKTLTPVQRRVPQRELALLTSLTQRERMLHLRTTRGSALEARLAISRRPMPSAAQQLFTAMERLEKFLLRRTPATAVSEDGTKRASNLLRINESLRHVSAALLRNLRRFGERLLRESDYARERRITFRMHDRDRQTQRVVPRLGIERDFANLRREFSIKASAVRELYARLVRQRGAVLLSESLTRLFDRLRDTRQSPRPERLQLSAIDRNQLRELRSQVTQLLRQRTIALTLEDKRMLLRVAKMIKRLEARTGGLPPELLFQIRDLLDEFLVRPKKLHDRRRNKGGRAQRSLRADGRVFAADDATQETNILVSQLDGLGLDPAHIEPEHARRIIDLIRGDSSKSEARAHRGPAKIMVSSDVQGPPTSLDVVRVKQSDDSAVEPLSCTD